MGVNIRYHLDLCMTGIALNGFHIAAVQLQLVSDTGMSETMENHFRQSLLLNQLIESTVDNLPLNRLAIGRTENQIEVYELVTEKVFQFFDVSLSLYQHFRYGFRYEHLADTCFGLRSFENQCGMRTGEGRWELEHDVLTVQICHRFTIYSLQLLFNEDACLTKFNTGGGNVNTVPGKPQKLAHSQGTGEGKV